MNSLLIGALGAIDVYYLNQDILLLASLAGWTDQPPAPHPYFAAFARDEDSALRRVGEDRLQSSALLLRIGRELGLGLEQDAQQLDEPRQV